MPAPYDQLFAHLMWADERSLAALRSAPTVPPTAITLMAHVLGAEHAWIDRIESTEPPAATSWPALDLEGCEQFATTVHGRYRRLLATLDDDALARSITYRNTQGIQYTNTLADILLHIPLHGMYHRGQISALIRASGATPNPIDYIAFVR